MVLLWHGAAVAGGGCGRVVGTTTTYLYDGLNLIREGGASTADYLFGPGIDQPLAMSRGGQVYYYGVDGLGSVSLVTDATGAVQNSYLYDAWGTTRTQTGSLANPFGYTARELGEAGTLFYRARYYSAAVGRFLSEDPIAAPRPHRIGGGRHMIIGPTYIYASSNPIRYRDPSGLLNDNIGWAVQGNQYCDWGTCVDLYPSAPAGSGPLLSPCARQALGQLLHCAAIDTTLILPATDITLAGCIAMGPGWPECVAAVLGVYGSVELVALALCAGQASDTYKQCRECNGP